MPEVIDVGVFTASALGAGMLFAFIADGIGALWAFLFAAVRSI